MKVMLPIILAVITGAIIGGIAYRGMVGMKKAGPGLDELSLIEGNMCPVCKNYLEEERTLVGSWKDKYENYEDAIENAVEKYKLNEMEGIKVEGDGKESMLRAKALVAAIITHESGWKEGAERDEYDEKGEIKGTSYGFMQVYVTKGEEKACGRYPIEKIKNDPEINIMCGAAILKEKYDSFKNGGPVPKGGCKPCLKNQFANYRGFKAALRGYNGYACIGLEQSECYVEIVLSYYRAWLDYLSEENKNKL